MTLEFNTQPADVAQRRRKLLGLLLEEERLTRPPTSRGAVALRCCWPDKDGEPKRWGSTTNDPTYAWRVVLSSQVVFDIEGEDEGGSDIWPRCVRDSHAICTVLNRWGVPYWLSLSGGMGIHIETFMRPNDADRFAFAKAVVGAANDVLGEEALTMPVRADPVCIAPGHEARLLREFGSGKNGHRKTLWHQGPSDFRPIPVGRKAAYAAAKLRIPDSLPIATWAPTLTHQRVREWFGPDCPQGPGCFPGPNCTLGPAGVCSNCPAIR